jgi:hypothetical protein
MAENMQTAKTSHATVETELLGHGLDWWNGVLLFSLALAAFSAFALVAASTGVIIVQKREGAASAERLAQTELKLQELRKLSGPRSINVETFVKALEGKPKAHVQIWYLPDLSDGWSFSFELRVGLLQAGWQVDEPIEIPEPDPNNLLLKGMPRVMAAGGQPSGVTIVGSKMAEIPGEGTPFRALWDAFVKGMQGSFFSLRGSGGSQFMPVTEGTLRIIVAAKDDPMFVDKPANTPTTASPK